MFLCIENNFFIKKIVLHDCIKVSKGFKHFLNFFKFSCGPTFASASDACGPPFGFGSKFIIFNSKTFWDVSCFKKMDKIAIFF